MKKRILQTLFLGALVFLGARAEALSVVYGSDACNFNRDLYQGMVGEDVRCLQQYLAGSQYGSYYVYPDGRFGAQTSQAVMQWQVSQGLYASGFWDGNSRSRYFELMGSSYGGDYPNYGNVSGGSAATRAHNKMMDALRMIGLAWEEIKDSNKNTNTAKSDLNKAMDDLRDAAWEYYANKDYDDAYDAAKDAFENAEDAWDEAGGGNGTREDADDAIDDAEEAIDEAEEEIEDAKDRKVSQTLINQAEDLLEDAEDLLEDAEDEYDDGDYDDAEELAQDAEDKANEAIDKVN